VLLRKSKIPFKAMILFGMLPSFMKKVFYRLMGYKIGKNVHIGFLSVVIGKKVFIDDCVKIGLASIVRAEDISIEKFVSIGSFSFIDSGKIRIGEDSRINEQVIIGGMKTPDSSLDLGRRTIIMEYSYINTTMPVKIGDDTGIGGHCLLFTHGSWLNQLEGFPVNFAPIEIGNSVWLPWRVFIMPGVNVGDKVVIGANSLVSKSIKSNCLVAGSPAKIIKENFPTPLTKSEKKEKFLFMINEFTRYLEYHDIKIEVEIASSKIIVIAEKYNSKAVFFLDKLENYDELISQKNDMLFVVNISDDGMQLPKEIPKSNMVLDINNKTRSGTSKIGEEFVRFISRYGLRFARMD
jgi:acetyltransferase-like isoleucine patch superfamily enzyme